MSEHDNHGIFEALSSCHLYEASHEGWFLFCPIWYREEIGEGPEPLPKGGHWWLFNAALACHAIGSALGLMDREFCFRVKPLDQPRLIYNDSSVWRKVGAALIALILVAGFAILLAGCATRSATQRYAPQVTDNTITLTVTAPSVQPRATAAAQDAQAVTPIIVHLNIGGIHATTGQTVGAEKTTELDQVGNPDIQGVPGL